VQQIPLRSNHPRPGREELIGIGQNSVGLPELCSAGREKPQYPHLFMAVRCINVLARLSDITGSPRAFFFRRWLPSDSSSKASLDLHRHDSALGSRGWGSSRVSWPSADRPLAIRSSRAFSGFLFALMPSN